VETSIRAFIVASVVLFIARSLAILSQLSIFHVATFINASRIMVKTIVFAFLNAAVFTIAKCVHVVLETRFIEVGVVTVVVASVFSIVKFVDAAIDACDLESI